MGSRREHEDKQDTIEWNKRIRRTIRRYNTAQSPEDKKQESIDIMDLLNEQANFEYELDGIILEEEQIDFIELMQRLIKGPLPQYTKPQNLWNDELSAALQKGDIIKSVGLMQIGRKLGYAKSVQCISDNAEYLGKLNGSINRIKQVMDRNEER